VLKFDGILTKMPTKALSEYSFLCFAFSTIGFLLSYVVMEKHAAKKRQKELEEANKALNLYAGLGKSAAKFCHEVSNYVGAISGNISLLHGKIDSISPEVKENVEAVQQISQDLIEIAKGFKNAVRGRFDDKKKWLVLQDVIEPLIISQTKGTFRKLNIRTECRCEQEWYASERIAEALLNLIVNACESMEDAPEKKLSIVAEKEDANLLVRVSDSGCGIPPEEIDRIFEYGFTTKPGGSGQGMSIAKQIIEDNGGTISVESRIGAGTTFTICLRPQEPKASTVFEAAGYTHVTTRMNPLFSSCNAKVCRDWDATSQMLYNRMLGYVFPDRNVPDMDGLPVL